jgi:Abnormal spindle-like microcephaly-assoc'd, ASPM-SPD-2-Hydin
VAVVVNAITGAGRVLDAYWKGIDMSAYRALMVSILVSISLGAYAAPSVKMSPEAEHGHLHSLSGVAPGSLVSAGQANAPEPKAIPRPAPPARAIDPLLISKKPPATATTAAAGVSAPASAAVANTVLGFAGVGAGDYGFSVSSTPPDTNMAVGATQVVQWVNTAFAVFDKATGALKYGPAAGNTLWKGLTGAGAACGTFNDGDPIVKWDNAAQRWVMMQFVVSNGTNYLQCVAVSQTADATGGWNLYAFPYTGFPDYPKAGVWSDAYYVTFNMFSSGGKSFLGANLCAYDRTQMLAGNAATQVCVQLSTAYGGALPADPDGASSIAPGAPNYIIAYDNNFQQLDLWRFTPNFTNGTATINATPVAIPVAAFTPMGSVPQSGSTLKLDSLSDRLMYRLAYRYRAGVESLLVSHAVQANSSGQGAVRWYEIQNPNSATPVVAQQGTYAPDASLWRWMSTGAIDSAGNMAFGYSTSSSTTFPSLAVATRAAGDPAGTLAAESVIKAGTGSETRSGTAYTRWGDYASMSVDPIDDHTMWFTSLYQKSSGQFKWSTWIHAFTVGTPAPTPGISVTPSSLTFGSAAATQSITVTSSGTADLSNVQAAISGNGFAIDPTSTCPVAAPATLAVGTTCTVVVAFTPTGSVVTGTVTVSSNAAGTAPTVTLTGGTAPVAGLTPTALTFASQALGTSSVAQNATLTNTGTGTLSITGASLSGTNAGDFTLTNGCGSSLAQGASCTIGVKSTPTSQPAGPLSATLTVVTNGGSPTVSLTGTSTAAVANVSVTPTSLTYTNVSVNKTSSKSVTVSNTGTAAATISGKTISGNDASQYSVTTGTGSCGSSIAAGATCTVTVRFKPTSTGNKVATLTITTSAGTYPVALSGN